MLAAVGPTYAEVAGEVADGLLVHSFTTERYLREVTLCALAAGAARAGRDTGSVEVGVPGFVVTGRDDQELATAAAEVRRQIAFYASTPAYRPVLGARLGRRCSPKPTGCPPRGRGRRWAG